MKRLMCKEMVLSASTTALSSIGLPLLLPSPFEEPFEEPFDDGIRPTAIPAPTDNTTAPTNLKVAVSHPNIP